MDNITDDWKLYQRGIDYNNSLHPAYYVGIDRNWRMYMGDQWYGVEANGLPTPVFNIMRPIINHFIAFIASQGISIQFSAGGMDTGIQDVMDLVTDYGKDLWELFKMDGKTRSMLFDGANSGDYSMYARWDDGDQTGLYSGIDPQTNMPVPVMGEIRNEMVDGCNVFFGNPNDPRVNDGMRPVQPYIIIAFRQMVSDLKAEAKKNKRPKNDIDLITPDTDTEYQVGDRGKNELLDNTDTGKSTCIIKLWPEKGRIMARKSVKNVTVRNTWNTELTIYPLGWGNWEPIKNSYHGNALGTGLIPNQLFVNKMFAMAMISTMNLAFPKVIYDKGRVDAWTNQVATAVGVNGPVDGVVKVVNGADYGVSVIQLIDAVIKYTKDFAGAYDAAMGNVKPDNASAIIAIQQAATIPLETIRQGMYQFVEDMAYIWLDMMIANYGDRPIKTADGSFQTVDFGALRDKKIRVKVDVGASSYWSQISAMQTLDNLLQSERITFLQYLKRLPDGVVPEKQALIDEIEQAEEQKAQMAMQQPQMQPAMPEQIPAGIA